MKRIIQKTLALLLTAAMVLSMGVLPAFAEGAGGGDSMPNLEMPVFGGNGSVSGGEEIAIPQTMEPRTRSSTISIDTGGKTVCANGIPIVIRQNDSITSIYDAEGGLISGETDVKDYWIAGGWANGDHTGNTSITVESGTLTKNVYGGSFAGNLTGDTSITIKGGSVGYICGGNQTSGIVTGNTSVTLSGGSAKQLFGGSHTSGIVTGDTTVSINGGTAGYVYGGGAGYAGGEDNNFVIGSTHVTLNGGVLTGNLYGGGGWRGATVKNSNVTVTGGDVWNVFGGGENASEVTGTATVVINCGDSKIKGDVYGGGAGFGNTNATVANADIQFISGDVPQIVGGGAGFNGTSNTTGDVSIHMEGGKTQFIYDRLNEHTAVTGNVSVAVTGGEIYTGGCVLGIVGTEPTKNISISVGKDAAFAEYTYIGIKQPVGGTLDIDMDGLYVPIILEPNVLENATKTTLTYRNLGSADGTWAQYNDNPYAVTKGSNPYLDWSQLSENKFDEMVFENSYVDFQETGLSANPKGFDTVTDKLTLDGGAMRVFFTMDTHFPVTEFKNNPLLYYGYHIKGGTFGTSVIKFASATGTAKVQLMARDGNPATDPLPADGVSQNGFDCVVAPLDTLDGTFLLQNNALNEGSCYWATNTYGSGGENNKVWQVVDGSACRCWTGSAQLKDTILYLPTGSGATNFTLEDVRADHMLDENISQCPLAGHEKKQYVFSYAISENPGTTVQGAAISGDQLSVAGGGQVNVAVTATIGNTTKTEDVTVYIVEHPTEDYFFNPSTDHPANKDIVLTYTASGVQLFGVQNVTNQVPGTPADSGIDWLEGAEYEGTHTGDTLTLTINKEYLKTLGLKEYEFEAVLILAARNTYAYDTFKIRVSDKNAAVVTLTPSKTEGVVYGDKVTYSASVAKGNSADAAELTGTVQFQVDGNNYGEPLALAAASATIDHTKLTAGPHTITATYSGDINYAADTDSAATTVGRAPIEIKVALDKASIYVGDALPTPSIAYEGLVGNDTLTPNAAATFDGMPANSNTVGTHTITWSNQAAMQTEIEALPSYTNYTATYTDTITLTIESRPSSGGTTSTTKPPVIETLPDGTVIKTQVTTKTDSSTGAKVVQETVTTTKPDGTVTKVETITVSGGRDGVTADVTTEVSATGEKTVVGEVTAKEGATSIKLPAAVVKATTGDGITDVGVGVNVGSVKLTFDAKALAALKKTAATPTVSVAPVAAEKLPEAIREKATAYDFTANGKGMDFDGGTVTVSIAYEKKDEAKAIAVYFVAEDGSLTRVRDAMYRTGVVSFPQSHWSTYAIVEETALPFTDVAEGDWYYEAVRYTFEHKLFSGTSATAFNPDMPVTRAMLMTVLARLDGQDTTLGEMWYSVGMEWAKAEGISDGTNPDGPITREQLATMLYRYTGSPETSGTLDGFADADTAGSFAADALRWAVEQGIISGKGNGILDPQGEATRAEVAAVFSRYMEKTN